MRRSQKRVLFFAPFDLTVGSDRDDGSIRAGNSTMPAKKKSRARKDYTLRAYDSNEVPLRNHAVQALNSYFTSLNGHRPAQLYELVLREVEEPLFKAVLDYASGNQSAAADILGINRGTLRKKLRQFGLSA